LLTVEFGPKTRLLCQQYFGKAWVSNPSTHHCRQYADQDGAEKMEINQLFLIITVN
jgi:hypothetical protein